MDNFFLFIALISWYYLILFCVWLGSYLHAHRISKQQPEIVKDLPSMNDVNFDLVFISVLYLIFFHIVGLS